MSDDDEVMVGNPEEFADFSRVSSGAPLREPQPDEDGRIREEVVNQYPTLPQRSPIEISDDSIWDYQFPRRAGHAGAPRVSRLATAEDARRFMTPTNVADMVQGRRDVVSADSVRSLASAIRLLVPDGGSLPREQVLGLIEGLLR